MNSLFLDTSFIIALEDADDQNHDKAMLYWRKFKKKPCKLVTTSYIFDETVTLLKRRLGFVKASEVGKRLLESSLIEMVYILQEDFIKGWEMFLKHKDKGYSFTDCLSFLMMEKMNINKALTFDEHFRQIGFDTNSVE